jgi:hypothetical protein
MLGREAVGHYTKRRGGAAKAWDLSCSAPQQLRAQLVSAGVFLLLCVLESCVYLWSIGVCCTWAMHSKIYCPYGGLQHRGAVRVANLMTLRKDEWTPCD